MAETAESDKWKLLSALIGYAITVNLSDVVNKTRREITPLSDIFASTVA